MTAGEIGSYCPSYQHLVFMELTNREKPKDNRVNSTPHVFASKSLLMLPITHRGRQGQSGQRKCTQLAWKDIYGHLTTNHKANQEDSKTYRRGKNKEKEECSPSFPHPTTSATPNRSNPEPPTHHQAPQLTELVPGSTSFSALTNS